MISSGTTSSNMPPSFPSANVSDGRARNAVSSADIYLPPDGRPNLAHLIVRELCAWVFGSFQAPRSSAALPVSVPRIIERSSQKQMLGIYAGRIIAMVQDVKGHVVRPLVNEIRKSMRSDDLPRAVIDSPISCGLPRFRPFPAFVFSSDGKTIPKAISYRTNNPPIAFAALVGALNGAIPLRSKVSAGFRRVSLWPKHLPAMLASFEFDGYFLSAHINKSPLARL